MFFLMSLIQSGWAHSGISGADTLSQDSLVQESRVSMWVLGLFFGNNSSYLGRYQSKRLPYYTADISYMHKSGLWASAMACQVLNSASFVDEVDVMGGYNFDISKKMDGSIYYSRYFFSAESELMKASVANALNASAGYDWNYVYSNLNLSYIFGGANDFFLTFDNSRYFEKDKLFHKSDYISFEPKLSVIAGTQTFVETHYTRKGAIAPPTGGGGGGGGKSPVGGGGETTSLTESVTSKFNVLSYEFSLPVTYTISNLSFEVAGRYSVPVNLPAGDPSVPQLFLTAGLFYIIY